MEQAGECRMGASREAVWAALNDPEVLKRCINGCQSIEQTGDSEFAAAVMAKLGSVNVLFNTDLQLVDMDPPNSYTLNASSEGGDAGFGKGAAGVVLADDGNGTLLRYTVSATVDGKLEQMSSQPIDRAVRKLAEDFFARFLEHLGEDPAGDALGSGADVAPVSAASSAAVRSTEEYQPSQQWKIWAIMFAILILAVVLTL